MKTAVNVRRKPKLILADANCLVGFDPAASPEYHRAMVEWGDPNDRAGDGPSMYFRNVEGTPSYMWWSTKSGDPFLNPTGLFWDYEGGAAWDFVNAIHAALTSTPHQDGGAFYVQTPEPSPRIWHTFERDVLRIVHLDMTFVLGALGLQPGTDFPDFETG